MVRRADPDGVQLDPAERSGDHVSPEGVHQTLPAGRQEWQDSGKEVSRTLFFLLLAPFYSPHHLLESWPHLPVGLFGRLPALAAEPIIFGTLGADSRTRTVEAKYESKIAEEMIKTAPQWT